MRLLQVNEIFGPTIQGEGPFSGHHCMFVRLYGCNLSCGWERVGKEFKPVDAWKCDTFYTWNTTLAPKAKECHEMSVDQVYEKLCSLWDIEADPTVIVVSGGEPMMQQTALVNLFRELIILRCPVHIETAGTIMPTDAFASSVSQFVVSPKLSNSGNPYSKRYKPKVLAALRDWGAYFKFVIDHITDFDEIDTIVRECNISPSTVMIMPEGTTTTLQLSVGQLIKYEALRRGYGITLRQHIMLWNNQRGH